MIEVAKFQIRGEGPTANTWAAGNPVADIHDISWIHPDYIAKWYPNADPNPGNSFGFYLSYVGRPTTKEMVTDPASGVVLRQLMFHGYAPIPTSFDDFIHYGWPAWGAPVPSHFLRAAALYAQYDFTEVHPGAPVADNFVAEGLDEITMKRFQVKQYARTLHAHAEDTYTYLPCALWMEE